MQLLRRPCLGLQEFNLFRRWDSTNAAPATTANVSSDAPATEDWPSAPGPVEASRSRVETDEAEVGEPEPLRADEPLLEAARQRPADAARFLKAVLFSGALLGVVVLVPVIDFFLSDDWQECGRCGRPLHIWLIVHCILHFVQTPLRFAFFWKLQWPTLVEPAADSVEDKIRRMTLSRAWRLSTLLSTAAYGWFVVGVVWLLNSNFCTPCPGLYRLTFGVMVVALAKPIATLGVFRYVFGTCLQLEIVVQTPPPRGARKSIVAALPLLEHCCMAPEDCQTTCAVCICDFDDGELLRRLPCGHKFHRACIDKWLRRSTACPLCMHNVELPVPSDKTSTD